MTGIRKIASRVKETVIDFLLFITTKCLPPIMLLQTVHCFQISLHHNATIYFEKIDSTVHQLFHKE